MSSADLRSRGELTQSLGHSATCVSHPDLRVAAARGGRVRGSGGGGGGVPGADTLPQTFQSLLLQVLASYCCQSHTFLYLLRVS